MLVEKPQRLNILFKASKYNAMYSGDKATKVNYEYKIDEDCLSRVTSVRDMGFNITHDLNFYEHDYF